jgi:large subunit ribosomal protein L6
MSRIGRKPITLPAGVTASIKGSEVTVKGPKGTLVRTLPTDIKPVLEGNVLTVERPSEANRHKALHGLSRTLVANMVEGVSTGYKKTLEIQGVGYKAEAKPYGINLVVGLSHQVEIHAPDGIKFVIETPTVLRVEGISM